MPKTSHRTALLGILGAIFVSSTGFGSLLPVLPLYLRERHASYSMVGIIVGSGLIAQALGQWPAGRLAGRVRPRGLMGVGLTVSAIPSPAVGLPLPVEALAPPAVRHCPSGSACA